MSSFLFNGVSSDTLGLIITQPIVRPTWQPETEFTAIPGRPRQNPYTKTWYPNSELGISAVIADASPAKVKTIYNTLRGYGVLTISTASTEMLYTYARLPVPEAKALLMAELPIIFECEPFAYATTETTVTFDTDLTVTNNGSVFCDPQITFIASSSSTDINCNGSTITVTTPTEIVSASYPDTYSITLDCDGQLAYYTKPNGDKVSCTQNTRGQFPRFNVGQNTLQRGSVQSATIKYRERWY